jgi:hypothetical protein
MTNTDRAYEAQEQFSIDDDKLNDRSLGFHWRAPPDLARSLDLPQLPRRLERVQNSFLAEAVLASESHKWVSYSRRCKFYSEGRRYRSTDFTYRSVISTADRLHTAGAIENFVVPPGNLGWQSSFRATPALMNAWHELGDRLSHEIGEPIILRDKNGKSIDYDDNRFTRRVRAEIIRINETLAAVVIHVPGEQRGHYIMVGESYVLPVPGNPLWRIYGRGSFSMGGRAYAWWQNVPKIARSQMTINGEPVAEADYSAMHATILYNVVGVCFVGDPYDLAGYDRDEAKLAFNIALNAANKWVAIGALANRLGKDNTYCATLLKAIRAKHKPIERYFCADAGISLMNADSELILSAVEAVNTTGNVALPVHDALIIPSRIANLAQAKMVESFERKFGRVSPCNVKIKL